MNRTSRTFRGHALHCCVAVIHCLLLLAVSDLHAEGKPFSLEAVSPQGRASGFFKRIFSQYIVQEDTHGIYANLDVVSAQSGGANGSYPEVPECGNGDIEGQEECDNGEENHNSASCTSACLLNICGDRHVNLEMVDGAPVEECDDGNQSNDDRCLNSCKQNVCGDGAINASINGVTGLPVEECDDGNLIGSDACTQFCQIARCGDGILRQDGQAEECDNGEKNDAVDNPCSNQCKAQFCGNGILENIQVFHGIHDRTPIRNIHGVALLEECDDKNGVNGDGCNINCQVERCGNGVIDAGEQCDDGNGNDGDGCSANCRSEFCGDGILDPGEECEPPNGITCTGNCKNMGIGGGKDGNGRGFGNGIGGGFAGAGFAAAGTGGNECDPSSVDFQEVEPDILNYRAKVPDYLGGENDEARTLPVAGLSAEVSIARDVPLTEEENEFRLAIEASCEGETETVYFKTPVQQASAGITSLSGGGNTNRLVAQINGRSGGIPVLQTRGSDRSLLTLGALIARGAKAHLTVYEVDVAGETVRTISRKAFPNMLPYINSGNRPSSAPGAMVSVPSDTAFVANFGVTADINTLLEQSSQLAQKGWGRKEPWSGYRDHLTTLFAIIEIPEPAEISSEFLGNLRMNLPRVSANQNLVLNYISTEPMAFGTWASVKGGSPEITSLPWVGSFAANLMLHELGHTKWPRSAWGQALGDTYPGTGRSPQDANRWFANCHAPGLTIPMTSIAWFPGVTWFPSGHPLANISYTSNGYGDSCGYAAGAKYPDAAPTLMNYVDAAVNYGPLEKAQIRMRLEGEFGQ